MERQDAADDVVPGRVASRVGSSRPPAGSGMPAVVAPAIAAVISGNMFRHVFRHVFRAYPEMSSPYCRTAEAA